MSIVRCFGLSVLSAQLLSLGCTTEDDGDAMGESTGSETSSTTPAEGSTAATTMNVDDAGSSGGGDDDDDGDVSSGAATLSDSSGAGDSSSAGSSAEDSGGSESGGAGIYDEEFLWVAGFVRTNCVVCHATNANGNLVLPGGPAITDDEIRLALDGIVATTGLKLVEPFDRAASQTYLQITNEFGAQFPVEDTDRFGTWIDAGAPYFAP